MNLKVLLPFQVFAEKSDVSLIVAETSNGSFGLLPNRLDCVAALSPGILIYEFNAWLWVSKEDKAMRDEPEGDDDA